MKTLVPRNSILVSLLGAALAVLLCVHSAQAQSEQKTQPQQDQTLYVQVKTWVKTKLKTIRGYWKGEPQFQPPPVAAAPKKTDPMPKPATAPPAPQQQPQQQVAARQPASGAPVATQPKREMPAFARPVVMHDIGTGEKIPRLDIPKEEQIPASRYALDDKMRKLYDSRVVSRLETPEHLKAAVIKAAVKQRQPKPSDLKLMMAKIMAAPEAPKTVVNKDWANKFNLKLRPEPELKLAKFEPLTKEEFRFLSGLYLLKQGQNGEGCSAAVGLFNALAKAPGWQAEADYHLAHCLKKLGMMAEYFERAKRVVESLDLHYAPLMLVEVGHEVPYESVEPMGHAALKASANAKLTENLQPKTASDMAYLIADYGVRAERFKTALTWSQKVPQDHPRYPMAQFLQALSEYQAGSKATAQAIQTKLINDGKTEGTKTEFQALVALNAARMNFQDANFKAAHENFLKVYKDHPLWLQSLTELGWAQLQSGDYEGAIGNMYSVQSPFFAAVYKPESYVIRTIGYLNLCQYGDAYRTLSLLERDYRPYLERMDKYMTPVKGETKRTYFETAKSFFAAPKGTKEVDGLPMPVVREMVRHRDFTNLQKALNRQIDERPLYSKVDNDTEKTLKATQDKVNATRARIEDLRKKLGALPRRADLGETKVAEQVRLKKELESESRLLNGLFFRIDLYGDAKETFAEFRTDVTGGADKRLTAMRFKLEKLLSSRLTRMKVDLARMLDNNELLRYEVFAGSGENIRYQVAGGEVAHRVPASVIPKSKSLQWDFDGEFWEDEIGHYRSSLKNNCPDNKVKIEHASLEGAPE